MFIIWVKMAFGPGVAWEHKAWMVRNIKIGMNMMWQELVIATDDWWICSLVFPPSVFSQGEA